ncbi:hypothetical protein ACU8MP_02445 [Rhizobium leguminosarum]|uniref:hypothetical protein n=1 Tax=Rhizobium leguminosarum TaxID=384 RepID=UPI0013CFCB5E|nr:hypothetical protein [Rhizobium leguminosarum]MBY5471000.1 hypothetical protein [Rhizobium leguminosarum]MBY5489592.1 hypothetical protein [Rhizobium leguminosarum]MBY5493877.1 hypothetical protein [Rhizobium leguminosarum]MBY5507614.1 hypothetical protein [Rhizobium leguminosarum]MBY5517509.1 hypothetical protein [Rhizobium leguminosarum]
MFGIAGAKEADGPEADNKGEEQAAAPDVAPNPSKKRAPPGLKNREHHLWATVLGIGSPMMPKRDPARPEIKEIRGFAENWLGNLDSNQD